MIKLLRNTTQINTFDTLQDAVDAIVSIVFNTHYTIETDDDREADGFYLQEIDTQGFDLTIRNTHTEGGILTNAGLHTVKVVNCKGNIKIENFALTTSNQNNPALIVSNSENIIFKNISLLFVDELSQFNTLAEVIESSNIQFSNYTTNGTNGGYGSYGIIFRRCNTTTLQSCSFTNFYRAAYFYQCQGINILNSTWEDNSESDIETVDCTDNLLFSGNIKTVRGYTDCITYNIQNTTLLRNTTLTIENHIDDVQDSAFDNRTIFTNRIKTVNLRNNNQIVVGGRNIVLNNVEYVNHTGNTYTTPPDRTIPTGQVPFTLNYYRKIANVQNSLLSTGNYYALIYEDTNTPPPPPFGEKGGNIPASPEDESVTLYTLPKITQEFNNIDLQESPINTTYFDDGFPMKWYKPTDSIVTHMTKYNRERRLRFVITKVGEDYKIGNLTVYNGDVIGVFYSTENNKYYTGGYLIIDNLEQYSITHERVAICYANSTATNEKTGFDINEILQYYLYRDGVTYKINSVTYDLPPLDYRGKFTLTPYDNPQYTLKFKVVGLTPNFNQNFSLTSIIGFLDFSDYNNYVSSSFKTINYINFANKKINIYSWSFGIPNGYSDDYPFTWEFKHSDYETNEEISFVDNTDEHTDNPVVIFHTTGQWNIKLKIVRNNSGVKQESIDEKNIFIEGVKTPKIGDIIYGDNNLTVVTYFRVFNSSNINLSFKKINQTYFTTTGDISNEKTWTIEMPLPLLTFIDDLYFELKQQSTINAIQTDNYIYRFSENVFVDINQLPNEIIQFSEFILSWQYFGFDIGSEVKIYLRHINNYDSTNQIINNTVIENNSIVLQNFKLLDGKIPDSFYNTFGFYIELYCNYNGIYVSFKSNLFQLNSGFKLFNVEQPKLFNTNQLYFLNYKTNLIENIYYTNMFYNVSLKSEKNKIDAVVDLPFIISKRNSNYNETPQIYVEEYKKGDYYFSVLNVNKNIIEYIHPYPILFGEYFIFETPVKDVLITIPSTVHIKWVTDIIGDIEIGLYDGINIITPKVIFGIYDSQIKELYIELNEIPNISYNQSYVIGAKYVLTNDVYFSKNHIKFTTTTNQTKAVIVASKNTIKLTDNILLSYLYENTYADWKFYYGIQQITPNYVIGNNKSRDIVVNFKNIRIESSHEMYYEFDVETYGDRKNRFIRIYNVSFICNYFILNGVVFGINYIVPKNQKIILSDVLPLNTLYDYYKYRFLVKNDQDVIINQIDINKILDTALEISFNNTGIYVIENYISTINIPDEYIKSTSRMYGFLRLNIVDFNQINLGITTSEIFQISKYFQISKIINITYEQYIYLKTNNKGIKQKNIKCFIQNINDIVFIQFDIENIEDNFVKIDFKILLSDENNLKLRNKVNQIIIENENIYISSNYFLLSNNDILTQIIPSKNVLLKNGEYLVNTTENYSFNISSVNYTTELITWVIPSNVILISTDLNSNEILISFTEIGTYEIEVNVTDSNSNSYNSVIIINAGDLPIADFSNNNAIINNNYQLLNYSSNAQYFEWYFQNTSYFTSNNIEPTIKFNKHGVSNVTLRAFNKFGVSEVTKSINVFYDEKIIEIINPTPSSIFYIENEYLIEWISYNLDVNDKINIKLFEEEIFIKDIALDLSSVVTSFLWFIDDQSFEYNSNYEIQIFINDVFCAKTDSILMIKNSELHSEYVADISTTKNRNEFSRIDDRSQGAIYWDYNYFKNGININDKIYFINNTSKNSPSPRFNIVLFENDDLNPNINLINSNEILITQTVKNILGQTSQFSKLYLHYESAMSFSLSNEKIIKNVLFNVINTTPLNNITNQIWTFEDANIVSSTDVNPNNVHFISSGHKKIKLRVYFTGLNEQYIQEYEKVYFVHSNHIALNEVLSFVNIGQSFPITWEHNNYTGTIVLKLYKNGVFHSNITPLAINVALGSYQWTPQTTIAPDTGYQVRIEAFDLQANPDVWDISNEFQISYGDAQINAAFTLTPSVGEYPNEKGYGTTSTQFQLQNLSTGTGIDAYLWEFFIWQPSINTYVPYTPLFVLGSNTSLNPIIRYQSTQAYGNHKIKLTAYNTLWNQQNSIEREEIIEIGAIANAAFTYIQPVYVNQDVVFNVSQPYNAQNSYNWEFTGANQATYNGYNPSGIRFNTISGCTAKLTVSNLFGSKFSVRAINVQLYPAINIVLPNSQTVSQANMVLNILWETINFDGSDKTLSITLNKQSEVEPIALIANVSAVDTYYLYTIAENMVYGNDYYIKIVCVEDTEVFANSQNFTILPAPDPMYADFIYSDNCNFIANGQYDKKGHINTVFTFVNQSTGGTPDILLWQFYEDDRELVQGVDFSITQGWTNTDTIKIKFNSKGEYQVKLTIEKEYNVTQTKTITGFVIDESPDADFSINGGADVLINEILAFNILSHTQPLPNCVYYWQFTGANVSSYSGFLPVGVMFTQEFNCTAKLTINSPYGQSVYEINLIDIVNQYIDIIYPTGETVINIGTNLLIQWQSNDISGYVNITLNNEVGVVRSIAQNINIENMSYLWEIPTDIVNGDYRILISLIGNPVIFGESQLFSITALLEPPIADFIYYDNLEDANDGKGRTDSLFTFNSISLNNPDGYEWKIFENDTELISGVNFHIIEGAANESTVVLRFVNNGIYSVQLTATKENYGYSVALKSNIISIQSKPEAAFTISGTEYANYTISGDTLNFEIIEDENLEYKYTWAFNFNGTGGVYNAYNPENISFTGRGFLMAYLIINSPYGTSSYSQIAYIINPALTVNRPALNEVYEHENKLNVMWDLQDIPSGDYEITLHRQSDISVNIPVGIAFEGTRSYSDYILPDTLDVANDYFVTVKSVTFDNAVSNSAVFSVVAVQNNLVADFIYSDNTGISNDGRGNTETEFVFTSKSEGSPTSFEWQFYTGIYGVNHSLIEHENYQITFGQLNTNIIGVKFNEIGTYGVCLIIEKSGLSETESKDNIIDIKQKPNAAFQIQQPVFVGQPISFILPPKNSNYSYNWQFVNANISEYNDYQPINVFFETEKESFIQLTVTDTRGYGEDIYLLSDIEILPAPSLIIKSPNMNTFVRAGQKLMINWESQSMEGEIKISLRNNHTGVNYVIANAIDVSLGKYEYNVPLIINPGLFYYVNIYSGQYNISVNSDNFQIHEVFNPPISIINIIDDCVLPSDRKGNTDTIFALISQSTGNPSGYKWEIYNNETLLTTDDYTIVSGNMLQSAVSLKMKAEGTYVVKLTVSKATYDDSISISEITVAAKPNAEFTINNGDIVYAGEPVSISVTDNENAELSYNWLFTGGTPSTSTDYEPSGVVFNNAGYAAAQLTVSGVYGVSTYNFNFNVVQQINPTINVTSPQNGLQLQWGNILPVSWEFTDIDTEATVNITVYKNDSPVVLIAENVNIQNVYYNDYHIEETMVAGSDYFVRVQSGDVFGDSGSFQIIENIVPIVVDFDYYDNTGNVSDMKGNTNTSFTFISQVTGNPTFYLWKFYDQNGNGGNMTWNYNNMQFSSTGVFNLPFLSVQFRNVGIYSVELYASKNDDGVYSSKLLQGLIEVGNTDMAYFSVNNYGSIYYNKILSLNPVASTYNQSKIYKWEFTGANIQVVEGNEMQHYNPQGVYFIDGLPSYSIKLSVITVFGNNSQQTTYNTSSWNQIKYYPEINIITPQGGEVYQHNSQIPVSWDGQALEGTKVKIETFKNGVIVPSMSVYNVNFDDKNHFITVTTIAGTGNNFVIKITSEIFNEIHSYSSQFAVSIENIQLNPDFTHSPRKGLRNNTPFHLNGNAVIMQNPSQVVKSWKWDFFYANGNPANDKVIFISGNQNSQNCVVKFDDYSDYGVELTVTNYYDEEFSIAKTEVFDVGSLPNAQFSVSPLVGDVITDKEEVVFAISEPDNTPDGYTYNWIFTNANVLSTTAYQPTGVYFNWVHGQQAGAMLTITNNFGQDTHTESFDVALPPFFNVTYPVAGAQYHANANMQIYGIFNFTLQGETVDIYLTKNDINILTIAENITLAQSNELWHNWFIPHNVAEIIFGDADYKIQVTVNSLTPNLEYLSSEFTILAPLPPEFNSVFTITDNTQNVNDQKGNPATKFSFTNNSSGLIQGQTTYWWEITKNGNAYPVGNITFYNDANGDMTSLTTKHLVASFADTGIYLAKLKVTIDIFSHWSAQQQITIYNAPLANFTVNEGLQIFNGQELIIENTSQYASTYEWIFENCNGQAEYRVYSETPIGIYFNSAGEYNITLIATSDFGQDEIIYPVTVQNLQNVLPVAKIASDTQWGNIGDTAILISNSINASSYLWEVLPPQNVIIENNFAQNTTVVCNQNGNYTTKLTVSNAYGSDFILAENNIKIRNAPIANFTANKTIAFFNEDVIFTNQTIGAENYKWSFWSNEDCTEPFVYYQLIGDNPSLYDENITVKFANTGYVTVQLLATNTGDELYYGSNIKIKANYLQIQLNIESMIELIYPSAQSVMLFQGQTVDIQWQDNSASDVSIYLLKDGVPFPDEDTPIATIHPATPSPDDNPLTPETFSWKIPSTIPPADDYKIKVALTSSPEVKDISINAFTIVKQHGTQEISGNFKITDAAPIPLDQRQIVWNRSEIENPYNLLIVTEEQTGKRLMYINDNWVEFNPVSWWSPAQQAYPEHDNRVDAIWIVIQDGVFNGKNFVKGGYLHYNSQTSQYTSIVTAQQNSITLSFTDVITTDTTTNSDNDVYLVQTNENIITITIDEYPESGTILIVKIDDGSGYVEIKETGNSIPVWTLMGQHAYTEILNNE